jgi:hypothetical protein
MIYLFEVFAFNNATTVITDNPMVEFGPHTGPTISILIFKMMILKLAVLLHEGTSLVDAIKQNYFTTGMNGVERVKIFHIILHRVFWYLHTMENVVKLNFKY